MSVLSATLIQVDASPAAAAPPNCNLSLADYDRGPFSPHQHYFLENLVVARATACLINAERAKAGLPALSLSDPLARAAARHTVASVAQKWWTGGADKHINPATRSTPTIRINAEGYCPSYTSRRYAEIAFAGAGSGANTPRRAVTEWMGSNTHRPIILNPAFRDFGVGVRPGSANPTHTARPNATYVATFGFCQR
ncbi:CAP domain-containing protein [Streptosporangium lutulentum]|uniref:Uncharacterized protein YkwD n=1 Tax=Streptosporangium lutulentum TaxID=1461250 RepID=A0ABT9Q2T0_9ACTN|nr:CAP domain-containing protein [Streptosporangium lutulentum]MDP9841012.1 uncharacterized protein YkwD [Streptosporangium lutulentum]